MVDNDNKCVDSVESNLWIVIGFLAFIILVGYLNDLLRDVYRITLTEFKKYIKKF